MRNKIYIFSIVLCIVLSFWGCNTKDYSDYKNEPGYDEYISDKDNGEITSFCGTVSALHCNKRARSYYNNNCRECDGFLITNYEDGICINRVLHPAWWNWEVPETLDGLPVVKIGCYLGDNNIYPFVEFDKQSDPYAEDIWGTGNIVTLPKTLKYIDDCCLFRETGLLFNVEKENDFYESDKAGNLFAIDNGKRINATGFYEITR